MRVHALLLLSLTHLCVFLGLVCLRICSICMELTRRQKLEVESLVNPGGQEFKSAEMWARCRRTSA